jgi:hypothetical protein
MKSPAVFFFTPFLLRSKKMSKYNDRTNGASEERRMIIEIKWDGMVSALLLANVRH